MVLDKSKELTNSRTNLTLDDVFTLKKNNEKQLTNKNETSAWFNLKTKKKIIIG